MSGDANAVRPACEVRRFPAWSVNRILPASEEVAVFHRGGWRTFASWDAMVQQLLDEAASLSRAQERLRENDRIRRKRAARAELASLIGTRPYTWAELQVGVMIGLVLAPVIAAVLL